MGRGGCAVPEAGGCCHRKGDAGVPPEEGGGEEAERQQEGEGAEEGVFEVLDWGW
jgi:hypothetical protein